MRRPMSLLGVCLVVGVSILAGACSGYAQQTTQQIEQASTLAIGSGDLVEVKVFDTPELSGKFRVTQAGTITLPQGGDVRVEGLSAMQAGAAIENRLLIGGIMLEPHVTVFVEEYASQGVIVLGEVNHPGTYRLLGGHSLYGALSAAGGVTSNEGTTITIARQNDHTHKKIVRVDTPDFAEAQLDIRVNPGDTVFVSRGGVVYVVGDVGHSGSYPMPTGEPLNVLQVVSLAQGMNRTAAGSKASIIRKTATGVLTIPVDLNMISKNKVPDPLLMASDILVVPSSKAKLFLDIVLTTATGAVLSAVVTALIVR
jgi:polysaccharide biosynthesis/export protein